MTCLEQCNSLCGQLGPLGPAIFAVVGLALAAFERWNAKRKLDEQKAAHEAALVKAKTERNLARAQAQELEVKVASIRPPPPAGGDS